MTYCGAILHLPQNSKVRNFSSTRAAVSTQEISPTGWARNPRGQGFVFGTEAVDEFLSMNDIRMVLRAHQCIPRGIDFFGPGETFLTVFSAPHYANGDNTGAIVQFNDQGELSFEYFAESKAPHVDIERPSPTLSDALHQDAS